MNLFGLNREPSVAMGKVVMPLSTRDGYEDGSGFRVSYNTFLGHPWLNEMRAVVSTFQQMIKFLNGPKV